MVSDVRPTRSKITRALLAAAARVAPSLLGLTASLALVPVASAASPYLEVPPREEAVESPAFRYANMTNEQALAELDRRGIAYTPEGPTPGVRAPVRLAGPLHGVDIHSSLPVAERAASPFEILDARLALAIDDFTVVLARHDVVELVHYTMYRPNVPPPGAAIAAGGAVRKGAIASAAKDPKAGATKGKGAPAPSEAGPRNAPGRSDGATEEAPAPSKPKAGKAKGKRRAQLEDKGTRGPKGLRAGGSATNGKELGGDDRLAEDTELGEVDVEGPSCAHEHGDDAGLASPTLAKTPAKPAKKAAPVAKGSAKEAAPRARGGKNAKKRILLVSNERPHGTWAPPGTRHPAGLAIDVGILKKRDGSILNVAQHFRGKIGDKTCGSDVPEADTPEARELRGIVCESRDAGIFTYALTPNFDGPHADHFHLEIKPGVAWFLYH